MVVGDHTLNWIVGCDDDERYAHLVQEFVLESTIRIADGIGAVLLKGSGEGLCASPIAIGPRQPRG